MYYLCISVFRIYFYFRMGDWTEQGPDGYATHVRAMQMAARSIHDVLNDTLDLHKYVLTGKISMTPRRFDFLRAAFETVEEGESLFNLVYFRTSMDNCTDTSCVLCVQLESRRRSATPPPTGTASTRPPRLTSDSRHHPRRRRSSSGCARSFTRARWATNNVCDKF